MISLMDPSVLRDTFSPTESISSRTMASVSASSARTSSGTSAGTGAGTDAGSDTANRPYTFSFSGRMLLWLPERVCSVRHTIAAALSHRTDTHMTNITETQSYGGMKSAALDGMRKSIFCLIAKSDSYSTASFYEALRAECIPVVISDWYVAAFPWFIPYQKFVIRIEENDFLKDPNTVLDAVKARYVDQAATMRKEMRYWRNYLSYHYQPVEIELKPTATAASDNILIGPSTGPVASGAHTAAVSSSSSSISSSRRMFSSISSILPFELMLREMQRNHEDILATEKAKSEKAAAAAAGTNKEGATKQKKEKVVRPTPTYEDRYCYNPGMCSTRVRAFKEFPVNLVDRRQHLCQHSGRLIGHYKIVYFMQCVRILWPLSVSMPVCMYVRTYVTSHLLLFPSAMSSEHFGVLSMLYLSGFSLCL